MTPTPTRLAAGVASLAVLALIATGCASGAGSNGSGDDAPADDATASQEAAAADVAAGSRLAVSLEGQVVVLDAATLEEVASFDSEEFTRLNPAGDGRHVFVTTTAGFQVLDTATPELTDLVFKADAAGHVVRHGGTTALFADGTGETTIFDTDALLDAGGELPEVQTYEAEDAHHGVSIVLEDGTLLTTVGDETSRSGAVALHPHDGHFDEAASSDECPGIHGEGTAQGEAVIFGCEDGALLYHDGEFEKFTAPDEYGRMGNAYVSETSPIIVGDYKNDPDAEGYFLHEVALIDTAAHEYEVVELDGIEYTWRGVVRGPEDNAYILGSDGSIHVLDPATGEITDEHPVIDAWESPAEWQEPHPALTTDGSVAYVADVANDRVVSVDLATGEVLAESDALAAQPNEMAVNIG
ncbi:zinc metallochaperone AztD [Microbacterium karelineae]|uniref:zinc metallochaperone AztD n=1 Tax=Microbacterium karelineae TaxID=2654283 RepID=UPI0012EA9D8A|nr:zinc metallochaperone AztD [Microbacterium karelineae]